MLPVPFRGSDVVAAGLLTWNQVHGPRYRRVFPDVYLPVDHADDLAARSRAAYLLVEPRGGLLAGYSAALLLGADVAPSDAPAEVLVTHRQRTHPGLRVHNGGAAGADAVEVGDPRLTAPARTAWDLCRRLPLDDGVVALDALARAGRFVPAVLLDRRTAQPGARGCRRLDRMVAAADPRAESPGETRLRLDLARGGVPPPDVQYEIRDEYGYLLARVDLAYPRWKLALEYDGVVHFNRFRRERDLRRDAMLAAYGWQTLRFGRDDIGSAQTVEHVRWAIGERSRVA